MCSQGHTASIWPSAAADMVRGVMEDCVYAAVMSRTFSWGLWRERSTSSIAKKSTIPGAAAVICRMNVVGVQICMTRTHYSLTGGGV